MIIVRTASIPIQKSEYIMVKWNNKVNAIIPHKHKRQSPNLVSKFAQNSNRSTNDWELIL